jgi:hypothetical protein
VPGIQTGLTDPAVLDNLVLDDLASNDLEHDKADVVDWRRPIIDYL